MGRVWCGRSWFMTAVRGARWVGAIFLAAVMVGAGGCASSWPKDVTVRLDPSAQEGGAVPSVDVHLVGVRRAELAKYKSMSVNEYWSPSGLSRQTVAARKEWFLGPGATTKTVSRNDPVWKQWNVKLRPYLVVLADLRGVSDREGGGDDPRRVVLPLDKKRWPGGVKVIRLLVRRDRVQVETPPKPKG